MLRVCSIANGAFAAEDRKTAQFMTRTPPIGPAATATKAAEAGPGPLQDAPEPAAQPACDGTAVARRKERAAPFSSCLMRGSHRTVPVHVGDLQGLGEF